MSLVMKQVLGNKRKSLSEKIAELIQNPNDSGSDESVIQTPVVKFDDEEYELPDAQSTEFRKKNVKLLSEQSIRYRGKVAPRNSFFEEDSFDGYHEESGKYKDLLSQVYENVGNTDEEGYEISEMDTDREKDYIVDQKGTNVMNEKDSAAEILKGSCVQNQLRIWERLLEIRIHSQKILNKSNKVPCPLELQAKEHRNPDLQVALNISAERSTVLLKCLLELQSTLRNRFSEIRGLQLGLKRPSPLQNYKDGAPPIKRLAEHLDKNLKEFRIYRNNVLLKWEDRTKLLIPGAGSKHKTLEEEYDIVRKIENTLINTSALIERSQKIKSKNPIEHNLATVGESSRNIYDDREFYYQQLRELIEYKASSSLSEVTKQYTELQELRRKMEKNVDKRASKGRKLRFVVHKKLVNFMAPDDTYACANESKEELYNSLFMS